MICNLLLKNVSTSVDNSEDNSTKESEQETLTPSQQMMVRSLYTVSQKVPFLSLNNSYA